MLTRTTSLPGDLLLDAERLLDRDLVERIDDPLDVVGDDSRAVGLDFDVGLGVGDALDSSENLHG